MKARLVIQERVALSETCFFELVVWELPVSLAGSSHGFKYRLAMVDRDRCVLRYDNEAGKGDHKHIGDVETPYVFVNLGRLEADFRADVESWRIRNG